MAILLLTGANLQNFARFYAVWAGTFLTSSLRPKNYCCFSMGLDGRDARFSFGQEFLKGCGVWVWGVLGRKMLDFGPMLFSCGPIYFDAKSIRYELRDARASISRPTSYVYLGGI